MKPQDLHLQPSLRGDRKGHSTNLRKKTPRRKKKNAKHGHVRFVGVVRIVLFRTTCTDLLARLSFFLFERLKGIICQRSL